MAKTQKKSKKRRVLKEKEYNELIEGSNKVSTTVVNSLIIHFTMGCNVVQACLAAGISTPTFYKHFPVGSKEFNRFMALREHPALKARATIFKNMDKPSMAIWYAENKMSDEFAKKTIIDEVNKPRLLSKKDEKLAREYEQGKR